MSGIREIEAPVSWRDVFQVQIKDQDLGAKVESFLTFFGSSAFKFHYMNLDKNRMTAEEFSGQQIVALCGEFLGQIKAAGHADALERNGLMRDGKFLIMQSDQAYDPENPSTRSGTLFASSAKTGVIPVAISLGTSYLKGARYEDVDGNLNPVTVEAVMTHALTTFAVQDPNSPHVSQSEAIILTAIGCPQPLPGGQIVFSPNINGGYVAPHTETARSPLGTEFDPRVEDEADDTPPPPPPSDPNSPFPK